VGGSETGKRAGLSHTGALAGPDLLYDGVFRQSGIIRARSVTELFDFSWVLGSLPTPRGNKVVIQTHSGGPGAAAADSCGRAGLELPALSKQTLEKLAPFVPHTGSINNPVDFTYTKNPVDYFSEIPQILLEEKNADILLMYFLMPSHIVKLSLEQLGFLEGQVIEQTTKLISAQVESIARLIETYGKPFVGYTFRSLEEQLIRELLERGVPVFPDPERAARAIKALVTYADLREKS
jgi:acyl-CoA synthetase (NDP forming)